MRKPYRIAKRIEEIITPNDVDTNDVSKLKKGLNGKIWLKGGKLKPEVRTKMVQIAKKFYEYLGLDYPIIDIIFTGSLANYNWTSHSDADIHIIFDLNGEEEDEFLADYIFAKKDLWSQKHDIKLYGFPIELFAKNEGEEEHGAKAIYSLVTDEWKKRPSKKNVQIDVEKIKDKSADIMNKIDDIEQMSGDEKISAAEKLKDKIKKMRDSGLESGGEYATENLVFKTLRNNGYLEKLNNIKTQAFDREMSLNEHKDFKDMDASDLDAYLSNNGHKIENGGDMIGPWNSKLKESEGRKKHTLKIQNGIPGMTDEKIQLLKDFVCFTCYKLKIEEPVTVVIRKGKDEYIATTASYLPYENENHIKAGGRAIVDICRSIGHELTHNRQRELGIFNPGDNVQNIGGKIEDEANSIAGILIKDFSHNYGYSSIYEL